MKKRTISALLGAVVLSLSLLTAAGAAGGYPDLPESHWAYEYMDKAARLGILKGVGDGYMAPDDTLTWAQCLTIAARTFAPEEYASAAALGAPWDVTAYHACAGAGFLLDEWAGTLDPGAEGSVLGEPITRQDMAVLLDRALPQEVRGRTAGSGAAGALADYGELSAARRSAVSRLFDLGIVQGSPAEVEGRSVRVFNGADILHRSDGATLFIRALDKLDRAKAGEEKTVSVRIVDNAGAPLMDDLRIDTAIGRDLVDEVAQTLSASDTLHYYTLYPESGDLMDFPEVSVSTACDVYTLTYYPMNAMERARQDFVDAVLRGELSREDYWWQPFNRYEMGGNDYKRNLLFGSTTKRRYDDQKEAEEHLTTVTVPLWRVNKNGVKYSAQGSFRINAALADDVVAIFTEIFNDPEQFPIKDLGGYGWRLNNTKSEHRCGTAIDINPMENCQIRNGTVETGSFWLPGENIYSITPQGSVVRAFAKYGWSWGGDAWAAGNDPSSGYHDYMHFSYMGE